MKNNAVSKSSLSYKTKKQYVPFDESIKVTPTGYSVAFTENNKAFENETVSFQSEALAMEFMQNTLSGNPNMADAIHVIPSNELNSAA
jgi:adenine-specific DNA methylase